MQGLQLHPLPALPALADALDAPNLQLGLFRQCALHDGREAELQRILRDTGQLPDFQADPGHLGKSLLTGTGLQDFQDIFQQ